MTDKIENHRPKDGEKGTCPTSQHFDAKGGKCVNDETKEYTEDPSSRDHSADNLKMPRSGPANTAFKVKKDKSNNIFNREAVNDSDIDVIMSDKAQALNPKVRDVGQRVQGKQAISANKNAVYQHKQFKNFSTDAGGL